MLEIIQHFKPLPSFLVFCLLVAKVNADQDSATPEIHPPIVEWEAKVGLLRSQAGKQLDHLSHIFSEETEKLKNTLLISLNEQLEAKLAEKDLDGSVELRNAITEYKDYTPSLSGETKQKLSFQSSLTRNYQSRIQLLRAQAARAMKRVENDFDLQTGKLRDQTVNELMKQVDAAMESKDLDQALRLRELAKDLGKSKPKLSDTNQPRIHIPDRVKTEAKLSSLKAGLLRVSFDRQAKQSGNEGFIAPTLLGKIVGDAQPLPTNALEGFTYPQNKNTAFIGFIKIDEPGEYVFKTYNYYDRNALFINHQLVCRYRGSVAGGSDGGVEQSKERIVLQEGYIPFVLVGYVDARGGIDTLRWAPPGSKGHEPLPLEKLYYSEELARSLNQQRQLFNFTAPKKL